MKSKCRTNPETIYDFALIWGNFQPKKVDVNFKR